jgi:hypothetical protein
MQQPSAEALRAAMKIVFELEHKCQQIDGAIAGLKNAIADPGCVSTPEAIGIADGLRWQLESSVRDLESLEKELGVERQEPSAPPRPSTLQQSESALRGSTRDLTLPDLISLLSVQEKTGTLWIKSLEENFILEFLRGAVVHAMSDKPRPEQRLGTILVARNKISTSKLDELLSQHGPKDGRIGELMARADLVSEDDLRDALGWQVKELFRRLFTLEYAVFSFREGAISKLELRVSLNATQLLSEAAAAHEGAEAEPS